MREYLRLSKSIVTCFCNVSYNSSFSRRSKRASFSRFDLLLLVGLEEDIFSPSFFFGVDSSVDSRNLLELFLLLDVSEVAAAVDISFVSNLGCFLFRAA